MNKHEKLHQTYLQATSVCDPIESQSRHQKLLYALTEYLLEPYYVEQRKMEKELERNSKEESK